MTSDLADLHSRRQFRRLHSLHLLAHRRTAHTNDPLTNLPQHQCGSHGYRPDPRREYRGELAWTLPSLSQSTAQITDHDHRLQMITSIRIVSRSQTCTIPQSGFCSVRRQRGPTRSEGGTSQHIISYVSRIFSSFRTLLPLHENDRQKAARLLQWRGRAWHGIISPATASHGHRSSRIYLSVLFLLYSSASLSASRNTRQRTTQHSTSASTSGLMDGWMDGWVDRWPLSALGRIRDKTGQTRYPSPCSRPLGLVGRSSVSQSLSAEDGHGHTWTWADRNWFLLWCVGFTDFARGMFPSSM